MTSQTTSPGAVDMDALAAHYTLHDAGEVCRFLAENPFLMPLILEAPQRIHVLFGPETEIRLKVAIDPEYPRDRDLFGLICTDLSTDEKLEAAERKLRLLQGEWLLPLPRAATRGLYFDVEPC